MQVRCDADEHFYDASLYSHCPHCRTPSIKKVRKGHTKVLNRSDTEIIGSFGSYGALPIVGWLVIIGGKGKGKDLRILPGVNRIGRHFKMDIVIDFGDNTISKIDHALLNYDQDNNEFTFSHGKSKNQTKVNGVFSGNGKILEAFDHILIGRTELSFVPFCQGNFKWE